MAAVAHKHIDFLERAFVEELGDALAGGIFALVVLLLDGFFAAAEASLGAQVDELLYFSELGAHDFLVW